MESSQLLSDTIRGLLTWNSCENRSIWLIFILVEWEEKEPWGVTAHFLLMFQGVWKEWEHSRSRDSEREFAIISRTSMLLSPTPQQCSELSPQGAQRGLQFSKSTSSSSTFSQQPTPTLLALFPQQNSLPFSGGQELRLWNNLLFLSSFITDV